MGAKARIKRRIGPVARAVERPLHRLTRGHVVYDSDRLMVWGKTAGFLEDKRFLEAYERGINSGQHLRGEVNEDVGIQWRVHTICWAAAHALHLAGDFVECGVYTGIYSLALASYVDLDATGKTLWLFDTFSGIPEAQMTESELGAMVDQNALKYGDFYEVARRNFEPFDNARLVRGPVPDTLSSVDIGDVAYLSIDMNIVEPEIAAIRHFWPKLVPGALVVLDDYGFAAHREQHDAMDCFAQEQEVAILTLPTGQGLLVKPPRAA